MNIEEMKQIADAAPEYEWANATCKASDDYLNTFNPPRVKAMLAVIENARWAVKYKDTPKAGYDGIARSLKALEETK